ncbi:hypothetical protein GIB67_004533 [Kingdonia uniflora]|uniref:DUF4283 domain-containing protein n=1 Tax=Kingdonia uniflora TaxID=39325 RepID=A0A7J7MKV6_9MAGN|nr:hypothetical protein GIB67_004533 [Kingdonia uniflora]
MDLWEMEVTSKVKALNNGAKKATFADLLQPKSTDLSLLPVPTMRGDFPSIRILEAGWQLQGELDNEADILRIWGGGPWHIEGQLLKVTMWTPDFDINKQKNTHAMVWVKFPGLVTEYWEEDVLMSMARTVGNPVQVDSNTLCQNMGFYATVLVDVDFSKPVLTKIMVEQEGFEFCQKIQLGRTPKIFSHCKVVGHRVSECRDVVKEIEQEKVVQNKADMEPKKKRRHRKKPAKNVQDKPGIEEALGGHKKADKQKEPFTNKTPSTTQPILPYKTFKGVVELWDRTLRNWDGSINSKKMTLKKLTKKQVWLTNPGLIWSKKPIALFRLIRKK